MPDEQLQRRISALLILIQQSLDEQNRVNTTFDAQIEIMLNKKNHLIYELNLQIEGYKQQLSTLQFLLETSEICAAIQESRRASDTLRLAAKLLLLKFETIYKPNALPEQHQEILNVYNLLLGYPNISDDGLLYAANNLQPLIVMAFMQSEFKLLAKLADINIRLYNNEYLLYLCELNKYNPMFAEPISILEKICLPPAIPESPKPIEPLISTFENVSLSPELSNTPVQIESPSPEPIDLDKFEYIPLPTPIIVTPEEKIDESISNLDYQSFNKILTENQHLQSQIFPILQKRFEHDTYNLTKIRDFLLGSNIDIVTCEKLLRLQKTNIKTKKALLDKTVNFDEADHSRLRNPEGLLNIANDLNYKEVKEKIICIIKNYKARVAQPTSPSTLSSASDTLSEDANNKEKLITEPLAIHNIKSTTKKERHDIFYLIENATTNQKINISNANKSSLHLTNNRKKTALMLALEKQLHPETIRDLVNKSKNSILQRDENQQNALDYWALYYNDFSHETIFCLWEKFKQVSREHGHKHDTNYELNVKRDINGNNFFHILLSKPDLSETQVLKSLRILFTKRDDKGFEENIALYGCLIVKNILGEIPTFNLYYKDNDWKNVYELLYSELPIAIMALSKLCHDEANIFFSPNSKLFSSNKPEAEHPIYSILENGDVERVVNIIERELNVKAGMLIVYESLRKRLNDKGKKVFDSKHSKAKEYFGKNAFYWQYHGQSVYGYIIDQCLENTSKQQIIPNNYELFLEIEERIPHIQTIAWKKIAIHLQEQTLSDELPIYIKQLTDKANTPDYIDNLLPLDYAFMINDIGMVKFLIEICKARIDDRTLVNCISMTPENDLGIFDYIYNKVFIESGQQINNNISLTMFLAIIKDDLCHSKYTYLVEKGFNPAAIDSDKRNLLQILLLNINPENEMELIPQAKILLDPSLNKPKTIQSIITNIDKFNNSTIDYLCCDAMENIPQEITRVELYKLIVNSLASVSSIDKLQHNPNVHFLCYAIMLNNVDALNTTFTHIQTTELKQSVIDYRLKGLSIVELTKLRKKNYELSDKFCEVLLSRIDMWSNEVFYNKQIEETEQKAEIVKTILLNANSKNESNIFNLISKILNELDSNKRETVITKLDSDSNSIMDQIVFARVKNRISAETARKLHTFMLNNVSSLEKLPRPGTGLLLQLIILDYVEGLKQLITRLESHPDLIAKIISFKERGANLLEIAQKNKELEVLSDEFLQLFRAIFDLWSKPNKLAITNKPQI